MTTEFEFVEPERMSWEQQKERMKKKTRELLERLMQPHSPLAFESTIWLSLSACSADRMNGTDRNQNIKKKKRIADSIETNTFFLRHKSKLIQFFCAIHSSLLSYICCFFHVLSFPSC